MQRFYFVLFLISILVLPVLSHAQTPGSIDSIEIRVTPERPGPFKPVTIKVESFLTDLNKANISWTVDGKQIEAGIGNTSFSLSAPANGKKSTIIITLKTVEGRDIRRTVELNPSDVSIAWEALGYTPPLFRGKALPSYQGSVRFVAMPELYKAGVRLDPKTLVYTWKKGSTVLGSLSGYGKQSAIISGTVVPEPMTVSVTVQSKDGAQSGEAATVVDFYDPEIVFYKEDPLYGVLYNSALGGQEPLSNNEFKIIGAPFYFSDTGPYIWSINGINRPDLNDQKSITFRNNGTTGGSSRISLEIRGVKNILQSARKDFTVYFSKQTVEDEDPLSL